MKDGNNMDAITKWMYNNPEALNMGLGLMKGIEEDRRNKALSGAEIAKTQYGYLTGAGTGDISDLNTNNIARKTREGFVSGAMDRRNNTLQEKLLQALAAKKGTTPSAEPNTRKPASSPEFSHADYQGGMSTEPMPIENVLAGRYEGPGRSPAGNMSEEPLYTPMNKEPLSLERKIENLRRSRFYKQQQE